MSLFKILHKKWRKSRQKRKSRLQSILCRKLNSSRVIHTIYIHKRFEAAFPVSMCSGASTTLISLQEE